MGLFSKTEKSKEMFITTEHTPVGYESLGLVTGIGAGETKKALATSKEALREAAAELGATAIVNFKVSPAPSVSGSNRLITYGDAVKKLG